MGRSRRKSALPEALRELGEAGLPEGYPDYWYGGGEDPDSSLPGGRPRKAPKIREEERSIALSALSNLVWHSSSQAEGEEIKRRAHFHGRPGGSEKIHIDVAKDLFDTEAGREAYQEYRLWKEAVPPEIYETARKACGSQGERELALIWAAATSGMEHVFYDTFSETRFDGFSSDEVIRALEAPVRLFRLLARGPQEVLENSPAEGEWSLLRPEQGGGGVS